MASSIAVVGAGAWGTALALQADRAGSAVTLVARAAGAEQIARSRQTTRLPGASLPESIAVGGAIPPDMDAILLVPPLQHLREVAALVPPGDAPLIVGAKGIEAGSLRMPLEIIAEAHPGRSAAFLTGPNFAHEVASGLPAAAVLAASDQALRARLIPLLATAAFRIYGNDDAIGAQVGAAAKNVIAIAAGAVTGAGLGENARAGLITRGLAELRRAAEALGGRADTVMGLSGLGDLLLTCTGASSRNYSLGFALGRGESLAAILAQRCAVTEGVATAPALVARAASAEMPVCRAVAALVEGRTTLAQAIADLLARPRRDE